MQNDTFSTDSGLVNINPTKGIHWLRVLSITTSTLTVSHLQRKSKVKLKKVPIQNFEFIPSNFQT